MTGLVCLLLGHRVVPRWDPYAGGAWDECWRCGAFVWRNDKCAPPRERVGL